MGGLMSALRNVFSSAESEQRVLMLGLDAAGKTTVLYKMHLNETVTTMPTIGFNVESVKVKSTTLCVWDIGGQEKIRGLWRHYYQNTDALVYVVDSADTERVEEAGEELSRVLGDDLMRDVTVLVFANKQDLPNALTPAAVAKGMRLDKERHRKWHVQGSNAVTGDGLVDGFSWMQSALKEKAKAKK